MVYSHSGPLSQHRLYVLGSPLTLLLANASLCSLDNTTTGEQV